MILKKASYLVVLIIFSAGVSGESVDPMSHWVNLGRTPDPEQAQALRDRARAALPDQVVIIPEDGSDGRSYRVASGPYMRRGLAEQLLGDARRSGFRDAWLSAAPLAQGIAPTRLPGAAPEVEADGADAGRYDAAGADAFVDRAPAGHELHKLRRTGDEPEDG